MSDALKLRESDCFFRVRWLLAYNETIALTLCLIDMFRPIRGAGNSYELFRVGKRDPAIAPMALPAHRRRILRWLSLTCLCSCGMASTLAFSQKPEVNVAEDKQAAPAAPQKLDEIRIYGTTEPEDHKGTQKTPLQKMRETLEKSNSPRVITVKESTAADGTRKAQVDVGGNRFCVEQRVGQIDFSGIGKGGMAMKPMPGKGCS